MTNEMVLERTSNLVMPSHYVELDMEEMSYVDGGAWWKWLGIGLIVLGAICVVASIFMPATAAGTMTVGAKCLAAGGTILGAAGGILTAV